MYDDYNDYDYYYGDGESDYYSDMREFDEYLEKCTIEAEAHSDYEPLEEEVFDGVYSADDRRRNHLNIGSRQYFTPKNLWRYEYSSMPRKVPDDIEYEKVFQSLSYIGPYSTHYNMIVKPSDKFVRGKESTQFFKGVDTHIKMIHIWSPCYQTAIVEFDDKHKLSVPCNADFKPNNNYKKYRVVRLFGDVDMNPIVTKSVTKKTQTFSFNKKAYISYIHVPDGPDSINVSFNCERDQKKTFCPLYKEKGDVYKSYGQFTDCVTVKSSFPCEVFISDYHVKIDLSPRVSGKRVEFNSFIESKQNMKIMSITIGGKCDCPCKNYVVHHNLDTIKYKKAESAEYFYVSPKNFYIEGNNVIFDPPIEASRIYESGHIIQAVNDEALSFTKHVINTIRDEDRMKDVDMKYGPKRFSRSAGKKYYIITKKKTGRTHTKRIKHKYDKDFSIA